MALTSTSITELLAPDLDEVYVDTAEKIPQEFSKIINVTDMTRADFKVQQVSGLGAMPEKSESSQFDTDAIYIGSNKTVTPTSYGLGVEISFEAWQDELYGVLEEMIRELARSSKYREEASGWSVLNNAFSTSYVGFEASTSLCSTSHVSYADGETRANRPAVDIGLSLTGIENMITNMETTENERGQLAMMAPSTLVIHASNKFTAREILGSSSKPYTSDNELNVLAEQDLKTFVSHYMTAESAWFGLADMGRHDLRMKYRQRPIFDMFDDPRSKNAMATCYQRHTDSFFGSWRGVYGSYVA